VKKAYGCWCACCPMVLLPVTDSLALFSFQCDNAGDGDLQPCGGCADLHGAGPPCPEDHRVYVHSQVGLPCLIDCSGVVAHDGVCSDLLCDALNMHLQPPRRTIARSHARIVFPALKHNKMCAALPVLAVVLLAACSVRAQLQPCGPVDASTPSANCNGQTINLSNVYNRPGPQ
jgi:hypothetical protein